MKKFMIIITISALIFFIVSGCQKQTFKGNILSNRTEFVLDYSYLNTIKTHEMFLAQGKIIDVNIENNSGSLDIIVEDVSGEEIYRGSDVDSCKFSITIPYLGTYKFSVIGHKSTGNVSFKVNSEKEITNIDYMEIIEILNYRLDKVREEFKWLEDKSFGKVILEDYEGNEIDITDDELFMGLKIAQANAFQNIVEPPDYPTLYQMTLALPRYKLTFYNNAENKVIYIYDDFITFNDKMYNSDFLCSLAKAYMSIIPALISNEQNLLNIMSSTEIAISKKKINQVEEIFQVAEIYKFRNSAIYIAHNMEKVSSLPKDDKLVFTELYVGYKNNEKIYLYIYDYNNYDAKFVKLVYKDKEEYYEQKDNLCINGEPGENDCLYKLWGAG